MNGPLPRALLIDLDGTLADSLPAMRAVYDAFLAEHGATGDADEFAALNGPALPEIVQRLVARHRLAPSPPELEQRYRTLIREYYAAHARPAAGAASLLSLAARLRIAVYVVTSAEQALAEEFLAHHRLRDAVTGIVTAEHLQRSKPDPAIYARALRTAGLAAGEVWAIEDSPNGVRAAVAAGIHTFGVASDPSARAALTGAHDLIAGLSDVVQLLEEASCDVEPLAGAIAIHVSDEPQALDADLDAAVTACWQEELRAHPSRFDGPLLSFVGREGAVLRGRFVPYRQFVAQRRSPSLAPRLGVVPLAVTGLVVCEDHVAWARRGDDMTQYPGWWELVPSGGIDRAHLRDDGTVDHVAQLLRELHEETGIAPSLVVRTTPLALLHDRCDDVMDVATLIEVSPQARRIAEETVATSGAEYRALRWVHRADLSRFLARDSEPVVPCSRALCRLLDAPAR